MVKESGVFYMKTDQEREMEKRVKERTQELMEIYRAEREQRKEAKASQPLNETKAWSGSDGVEEHAASVDRRKERNRMEDRVDASPAYSRLCSHQQSASHDVREETAKPSSRLNSGRRQRHSFPSHF